MRTTGGSLRGWLRTAVVGILLGAVLLAMIPTVSVALPIVPFTARFSADDNGTIAVFGNNLMSCPESDARCGAARAGTANLNNNSFVMQHLDADSDPGTFNSSSAEVRGPAGADVLWAGLYWGARLSRGTGGVAGTGDRQQMSLRVPGASGYQTVRAQANFGPTAGDLVYQEFAEVTSIVRAAGEGAYWGANVVAGTGEDRYAGWSLVVVYRAPDLPLRNLTVFDGFADVGRAEPQEIVLSGFRSPANGPVETQLGMVAYEGDFATSGDTARLNDTQLSTTPLSRGSNFFNGTNDTNGQSVAARVPAHLNMLGFDVKNLAASGIPNGATSATISLESTGDRYLPGVVTTAIRLFAPDFTASSKTVANLAGRSPGFPGDELEYTITYPNTGQDDAVDAVMTDTLPAGTTYLSAVPTAGACTGSGRDVSCDIGTIAVGQMWQVRVRARVEGAAGGTTLRNAALLDYEARTLARDLRYAVAPAEFPVSAVADLSITKTMAPDPAIAGGQVTATIVVANAGPNAASAVQVVDALPAGATVVSATTAAGTCSVAAASVACDLGDVPSGAEVPVSIVLSTAPGSDATSLVNVATVSSPTADLDPSDNSSGATVVIERAADLAVTKTVDRATVLPGGVARFTVIVRNDGPSDARDVIATDSVGDTLLALTAASAPGATCSVSGAAARCATPVLAPGASLVMTVDARLSPDAPAGAGIVNSATATAATPDRDASDNADRAGIVAGEPSADLTVSKTVGPMVAGGQATYTVTVVNEGPSTATGVTVDDVLPAGIVAVSAVSSRGTCAAGAAVSCDIGTLPGPDAAGRTSSATITIVADVPAGLGAASVSNTASVSSATADPDPVDDSATVTAPVATAADVVMSKTASPVQPAAGEDVTFTLTATGRGPSVARDVVVTDVLPPGLLLGEVVGPPGGACEESGGTLTCDVGDLGPDETATVLVTMTVPPDFDLDAGAANTATASSATPDPVSANNSATATITARAVSDLVALKWDTTPGPTPGEPPRAFAAGEQITYFVAAGNLGPSDAASAVVTDTLPAGVTYVSSVPECQFAPPATVTCALPTVPDQFAAVFPIVVRVDADLQAGALLTNSAVVELTDPDRVDPSTANNLATVTNPVTTRADLAIAKRTYSLDLPSFGFTIPSSAPAGAPSGYLIDVRNDGPSIARDVVLVDSSTLDRFFVNQVRIIRDGVAEDITARCSWSGGDLQCPLGDIPPFAAGAPSWTVQVDGVTLSDAAEGSYVNTATLTSATPDADPTDNTAQAPITVTGPVATLTLDKQAVGFSDVDGDGDGDVVPGAAFAYDLTVANVLDLEREGAADAPDVVVTDTLPPGFVVGSVSSTQGSCAVTPPATVRCELGTVLGPGRVPEPPPVRITVSGTTSASLAGTASVTNTATVASPVSAPVSATATNDVVAVADISLTKLSDAVEYAAGGTAGFSLVVTNAGPSDAVGTEVGDLLPAELEFDPSASDPSCTLAQEGGVSFVSCAIGTLTAGETRTVRVGARIDSATPAVDTVNVAAASSPVTGEYDFTDNRSEVPVRIVTSADLVVSKTADTAAQAAGGQVVYSASVTNAGPSDAAGVALTDILPPGTSFVSATGSEGLACAQADGVVRCAQGVLAAGATATATIVVALDAGLDPGPVVNAVSASSETPEADPATNEATATVDVFVLADTAVTKTLLTADPVAGRPVAFAIDVVNHGPQRAPRIVVSDALPDGFTFVSAVAEDAGSCQVTAPEGIDVVTCEIGSLDVGTTRRVVVTAVPDPGLRASTNGALVGSAALDQASGDNYDEVAFALAAPAEPEQPEPSPTASGPGAGPDAAGTPPGGLPPTGGSMPLQVALWGVALIGTGAVAFVLRGLTAHVRRARRTE